MELRDYVEILRRYWVMLATVGLLGLSAGAAFSLLVTPKYEAQTQVYVSVRSGASTTGDLVQGAAFVREVINSFVQVVETSVVLDPVIEELDLDMTASKLAKHVKAQSVEDSALIEITASSPSDEQSALIANAVGESFKEVVSTQLEPEATAGESRISLTTTQPAVIPEKPTSPKVINNVVLGLFAGLVLSYGAAVLRAQFDNRIRSVRDVEKITAKPVLGRINHDPEAVDEPLLWDGQLQSPRAESYRTLRTNIQFLSFEATNRVFVVTSPSPNEGKRPPLPSILPWHWRRLARE